MAIEFKQTLATLSPSTPDWSPPNSIGFTKVDLEIYGLIFCIIEWSLLYIWLGVVLRDVEYLPFHHISLSGRVSLCILLVYAKSIIVLANFQGTLYVYHTIISGVLSLLVTTLSLLFHEGPLKALRSNNRKSLMPAAPNLPGIFHQLIEDQTEFREGKAFFQIPFIFYELYVDSNYWNYMSYKYYQQSIVTYMSGLAQHSENNLLVSRMLVWIDKDGYIRKFTFRLPSTMLFKRLPPSDSAAIELIAYQYPGETKVRYYYSDIPELNFKLDPKQKTTMIWLLSELNDCAIDNLRPFKVSNFINARVATLLSLNRTKRNGSRSRSRSRGRSPSPTVRRFSSPSPTAFKDIPSSPITAELDKGLQYKHLRSPSPLCSKL